MTVYHLFSDPHLGTRRAAHTTRDSARRLQAALYRQALVASEPPDSLCLGDLFDRSTNDEATLVQGYEVAKRCRALLSGNHDLTNREGVVTSLHAVAEVLDDDRVILAPSLSTPYVETLDETFWIVPHHASQALFEQALWAAKAHAARADGHRYLLLHCNYDCPFDTEDNVLNLAPEHAEALLTVFTRIFIGHEHNPKTFHGERLVLVGNTHPTSFADISDKYRWELDTATDTLSRVRIWDRATSCRDLEYGQALPDLSGVQFVDVLGTQPVDNAVAVAEYVRSVWEAGDDLLAVRNHVEIRDHLADLDGTTHHPALVDLKQRILDDLEGSDLQALYRQLLLTAEQD